MKKIIVIPTLNPSEKIWTVVEELKQQAFDTFIIANDGSDASKQYIFEELQQRYHCHVLVHAQNKGKGAALKNAIAYAKDNFECVGVLTLDDDGQHLTKDVVACAKALEAHPDSLVLGVRDFTQPNVPPKSKLGNTITAHVIRAVCGLHLKDTQTGLRGIPRAHFDVFLQSKGDRFEYETSMLLDCARHKIAIEQVIIETVYIDNNSETHFHPIKDSFKVYKQIFGYYFSARQSKEHTPQ